LYLYYVVPPAAFVKAPLTPAAYPFFELYPASLRPIKVLETPVDYPVFNMYPDPTASSRKAVAFVDYPYFDIYPARSTSARAVHRSPATAMITGLEPALLRGLGYPESLRAIYPSKADAMLSYKARSVSLPGGGMSTVFALDS
jgi:hypothetical protein